jgi:hypothetical protein
MGIAPGQSTNQDQNLEVIATPWLNAAAIISGTLSTTYYLLAEKMISPMVVNYLTGMRTPQVAQYDAGSVLAANYKIYLPFEADLVNMTVGSTVTIAGAQQGTVA